ncbi:hypothetical protein LLH00_14600 [bacterium]|nr:hypothetical protein [bacterium]
MEQAKKRGLAFLQGEQELEYFGEVFARVREYDFEGLMEVARSHPEELKPVLKRLEEWGARSFEAEDPVKSYKFYLLRKLFAPDSLREGLPDLSGGVALEDCQLMELFLLFATRPFGVKENNKVRARVQEWELTRLRDWAWNAGLTVMLNERYRELKNIKSKDLPIPEILEKVKLPKLLDENQILDNYVFDNIRRSKSVTGMKTDTFLEKKMRQEAMELRDRLYTTLNSPTIDYNYLKKNMLDLHMEREAETIERSGFTAFNNWLDANWIEGARELAAQNTLEFFVPTEKDPGLAVMKINHSLLNMCRTRPGGAKVLQREALFGCSGLPSEAACYLLRENYLVLRVLQEETVEHILVVQLLSNREREKYLTACLSAFFSSEDPKIAAALLVERYLNSLAGWLRLRKAMRNAAIAFPVILVTAAMLAWIYNNTMGGVSEGLMLGMLLGMLGEIIAARNGYAQKVRPESHEKIPVYTSLTHAVQKLSADEIPGVAAI